VWLKSGRIKYSVRFLVLERIPLEDRQMQFAGWSHWERQAGDHYNCQPVGFIWFGVVIKVFWNQVIAYAGIWYEREN
jgi:hypothetical protein